VSADISPFFLTGPNAAARRRLLLVSWHFAPAQTAGALRWQKMSRYAAERGWAIDVITLAPSSLRLADQSSLAELPAGVRLFGVPKRQVWEERLEDRASQFRRWLVPSSTPDRIPDSISPARTAPETESLAPEEIRWRWTTRDLIRAWTAYLEFRRDGAWAARVTALGRELGARTRYDAVMSSGPPHLAHSAARRIGEHVGVPVVLDFRDPFALVRRLPAPIASPLWFALARRHERPAVARARLITVTTDALRAALERIYPEARDKIVTVTNGCDDEQITEDGRRERFVIAYAGALYLDRDPTSFFRAAAATVRAMQLRPAEFGIDFIGHTERYGGARLQDLAAAERLEPFVRVIPQVPRTEALRLMSSASMLLNLPQDSPYAIPSKVFEYMLFDAWLLVLADRGTPTELLLRDTGAHIVAPTDVAGIGAAIRLCMERFRRGERPARISLQERFTRRYQAGLFLDALDRAVFGRTAP